jgi:hypothetical protein
MGELTEYPIAPDRITVESFDAEDIASQTDLTLEQAMLIEHVIDSRLGGPEAVVIMEEWARETAEWSDYDITPDAAFIVGEGDDTISDKALLCKQAFDIHVSLADDRPIDEVTSMDISSLVSEVDEREPTENFDGMDDKGERWVPFSGIADIVFEA